MKKIIICLILTLAFSPCYAAEGKAAKGGYFENLLKGLKTKIQSKLESKNRVSAVAAVRGAKQGTDAYALYWKGGVSDKAQKKLGEDKKKLADAVQLVVDGNVADGKAALEKFLRENSDSVYAPDAKDAIKNLPQDEAAPAVTEEKADETEVKQAPKKPSKPAPKEEDNE